MKDSIFSFGLSREVPEGVGAAWGARWIFPDDIVWDRTSWYSPDMEAYEALKTWLDSGALMKARVAARERSRSGALTPVGQETVVLHQDEVGKIVANPQRSHGYLYVAAWLKESDGTR